MTVFHFSFNIFVIMILDHNLKKTNKKSYYSLF